jgi:hypothetical protein
MKFVVLAVAVLVSTSAFASDLEGSWQMSQITCSGGTKLDLGGVAVTMTVDAQTIRVGMAISDISGCELHQISNYTAQAGKLAITPVSSGATKQCGDEFTVDMSPSAFDYIVSGNTLTLSSPSTGDGGCPAGETEVTVLTRK